MIEEKLKELERDVAESPNNLTAQIALAGAYEQLGLKNQACERYVIAYMISADESARLGAIRTHPDARFYHHDKRSFRLVYSFAPACATGQAVNIDLSSPNDID